MTGILWSNTSELRLLRDFDLIYLATPYTLYPKGIEQAFTDACEVTGYLVKQMLPIFSPIVHSHPVALESGIEPRDGDFWLLAQFPFMKACTCLLVAEMDGWAVSRGVGEEMKTFTAMNKPIYHLSLKGFPYGKSHTY